MKKEYELYYHTINSHQHLPACYSFAFYKGDEHISSKTDKLSDIGECYDINKKFVESAIHALSIVNSNLISKLKIYTRSPYVKEFLTDKKDFIKQHSGVDIEVVSMKSNRRSTKTRADANDKLIKCIKSCEEFRNGYTKRNLTNNGLPLINLSTVKRRQRKKGKKKKEYTIASNPKQVTTDASFDLDCNIGAWAVHINDGSKVYKFFGLCGDDVKNSSDAEICAIMNGLSKCEEIGLEGIVILTDAQGVVNKNKGSSIYRIAKKNDLDVSFNIKWIERNSTEAHAFCDHAARKTMRNFRTKSSSKRAKMLNGIKRYKYR